MCVDMDSGVIDDLSVGKEKELYEGSHLIAGGNSSNGLFAKGWGCEGSGVVSLLSDSFSKTQKLCINIYPYTD